MGAVMGDGKAKKKRVDDRAKNERRPADVRRSGSWWRRPKLNI